nr:MAG TPA: hypothetical protein [Caudoviricetes sp.]
MLGVPLNKKTHRKMRIKNKKIEILKFNSTPPTFAGGDFSF